jgi:hypothetical protein
MSTWVHRSTCVHTWAHSRTYAQVVHSSTVGLLTHGDSTGTPGYMAGGPVRQPYAGVDFIPQPGIYVFGYRFLVYACTTVPTCKQSDCATVHHLSICATVCYGDLWIRLLKYLKLMRIKQRLIDTSQKISFNLSKTKFEWSFLQFAFQICKKWYSTNMTKTRR